MNLRQSKSPASYIESVAANFQMRRGGEGKWGVEFLRLSKREGSDFSHKNGGVGKADEVVY